MTNVRRVGLAVLAACSAGMMACQVDFSRDAGEGVSALVAPQEERTLAIDTDTELPNAYPQTPYDMRFRAHGSISTMHWRVEKGAIPPGMKLEDDGWLHGQADHPGEFQFVVSVGDVRDSERAVQKGFVLRVLSAFSLAWKAPAKVSGNRIDGSVEVSNMTPDDMDLTFYVLAVAENGRATAIGYQHFLLRTHTVAKELPFGETLPHGQYEVHADAVGEVERRNMIYRQHLQTPGPLQVVVGP